MQGTVEGYIDHIIFRNEENGYTVLSLIVDGEELTCVGFFQYVNEGEMIKAEGSYTEHAASVRPEPGSNSQKMVSKLRRAQIMF